MYEHLAELHRQGVVASAEPPGVDCLRVCPPGWQSRAGRGSVIGGAQPCGVVEVRARPGPDASLPTFIRLGRWHRSGTGLRFASATRIWREFHRVRRFYDVLERVKAKDDVEGVSHCLLLTGYRPTPLTRRP